MASTGAFHVSPSTTAAPTPFKSWEGRWELINGIAYDMTPAPGLEHQRISSHLHVSLEWGEMADILGGKLKIRLG